MYFVETFLIGSMELVVELKILNQMSTDHKQNIHSIQ